MDALDTLRGRKTVAAKMTDVPGHTKGIVPMLAKHGIKLLHIGVNGASALVDVPPCFLWKNGDSEVVVIYSGAYGGAFKSDLVDEILYFDHTLDNHGAPSPEKVLAHFDEIQMQYPDYEITAGTIDDFADVIWEVRHKLPVFEGEMGDSWIHGSATDPYKSACLRTLMRLKRQWPADGTLDRNDEEYKKACNEKGLFIGLYSYISFDMLADYYEAPITNKILDINHVKNILFSPSDDIDLLYLSV